jgi:DNA topoisomerase-1
MPSTSRNARARRAGLRYVSDARPGIRRLRRGRGFEYKSARGARVSARTLERIRSLAIPPAWEQVWISADERGHLQATGYDARGRKQYRYHPAWSAQRNAAKYDELLAFARALPRLRRQIARDLRGRGVPRERVIACVLRLLDRTLVRIGNEEYARDNRSYGLTTLRNKHIRVAGDELQLKFRAKSGMHYSTTLDAPRVARVVRRCLELPGQQLFAYMDEEGRTRDLDSGHVNDRLRELTGSDFTSKHFRTWGGSVLVLEALHARGKLARGASQRERTQRHVAAIDVAAQELGNTRAVCRRYYVHPLVLEADGDGRLAQAFAEARKRRSPSGLSVAERALLRLLARSQVRRKA